MIVLAFAFAVTACSVAFERPPPGPLPPVAGPAPTATSASAPPPAGAPETNQASSALLGISRSQSAAGEYDRAAATIERALAIDPNSAALWIELAEIRWYQGDRDQADSLARKALTLAGSDASIVARADRLTRR